MNKTLPALAARTSQRRWPSLLLVVLLTLPQFSASAELPTLGDPTLDSLSHREEKRLGLSYYRSIMNNVPVVDDVELGYYLKSLAQKLITQSDLAGQEFTFFIVKSSAINAFALPGGYIGVNSGLILDADTESQLASVLAHEISHVTQRHIARMFDRSGTSTAVSIATVLAALLVGTSSPEAGQAVLVSGIAGTQQSSINFTRQNEYEADRVGFELLVDAGINPEGMVEFFEHLMSQSGGLQIEYLRTHPLDVNRVSEARNRIKDSHRELPKNSDDFLLAKARLAVLSSSNNALNKLIERNEDRTSAVARYLTALAYTRSGRAGKAAPMLEKLAKETKHPWIRLALADALERSGDTDKAEHTLETLHDLYPGYLPVTLAYASLLNHNQESIRSIELLQHQLQQDRLPVLYEELARAYYRNGQVSAALEATGNQYALQGYMELALQQFENALNQPGLESTAKKRLEARKSNVMIQIREMKN